jgi:hypothetical protein
MADDEDTDSDSRSWYEWAADIVLELLSLI